jgi:hypothetical protein
MSEVTHTYAKPVVSSGNAEFISDEVFVVNLRSLHGTRWRQQTPPPKPSYLPQYTASYSKTEILSWRFPGGVEKKTKTPLTELVS